MAGVSGVSRLPMFPLSGVLLPGQVLPLHVFEERYRVMTRRCLEGDGRFGVVLIERGQEVGGGDTRFPTGTVAQIVRHAALDDGRYALEALGRERLRVARWLPDDPYPQAEIELLDEPVGDPRRAGAALEAVGARLARIAALRDQPPPSLALDPVAASYQGALLAGVGPLDALHLLEAPTAEDRLTRLAEVLDDVEMVLRGTW